MHHIDTILQTRDTTVGHTRPPHREAFLALERTTPFHPGDYPTWHRGRSRYAVWVVELDEPGVLAYLARAREPFADMLYQPFLRQPHVTVFVSGFWVETPQWDDDYSPTQRRAQQRCLQQLTLSPFTMTLGGLNSFASALYVEVCDSEQGLATMRQALQGVMPELRWAPYVPHITLGMYCRAIATRTVVQRMQQCTLPDPISTRVRQVKLITYAAQEALGPLQTMYVHTL